MGKWIFRATVLIAALALVHCTNKKSESSTPRPAELDTALTKAGNPNFNVLTKMLIHKHQLAFNSSALAQGQSKWGDEDFAKAIGELTPSSVAAMDPFAVKLAIDAGLVKRNGGKPLVYNRDHTTIASPLRLGRMQCYSGSILQLLITRQMDAKQFQKLNMVMILTPGHVLPGFMIPENGSYRLVGVETTVTGRGRTDFGLTHNLNTAVRVVDADVFTQIEVLGSAIENSPEVMKWALEETAKLYDIPLQRTEELVAKASGGAEAGATGTNSAVNASNFGFGKTDDVPPEGDIERVVRDEVPTNKGSLTDRFIQSPESAATASTQGGIPSESPMMPLKNPFGDSRYASQFLQIPTIVARSFNDAHCAPDTEAKVTANTFMSKVRAVLDVLGSLSKEELKDPKAIMAAIRPVVKELPIRPTLNMGGTGERCQEYDGAVLCNFGSPGIVQAGFGISFIIQEQRLIELYADNQLMVRGDIERDADLLLCGEGTRSQIFCKSAADTRLDVTTFGETDYSDLTANLGAEDMVQLRVTKRFQNRGRIQQRRSGASLCSPVIPGSDKDVNPTAS